MAINKLHLTILTSFLIALTLCSGLSARNNTGSNAMSESIWKVHDWSRPRPSIVTPPTPSTQQKAGVAPSDAIVLFDGTGLDLWRAMDGGEAGWIVENDYIKSVKGTGSIRTLQGFGDCQLHLEFMTPTPPKGKSQGRGNSGVFLMGIYEVQILDSYDNVTYADGQCSALYGQYPPHVNVCRKPGEWQTYDIVFKAPRFAKNGDVLKPAVITVFQNGVLTQDHVELQGPTNWCSRTPYKKHPEKLPISLQDHGNPVRFRNIWIRELPATGKVDAYRKELILAEKTLDSYAGKYRKDNGEMVTMRLENNHLYSSQPQGSRQYPIYAESLTRFYSKFVQAEYEFVIEDSTVTALKVNITNGGWSRYTKVE